MVLVSIVFHTTMTNGLSLKDEGKYGWILSVSNACLSRRRHRRFALNISGQKITRDDSSRCRALTSLTTRSYEPTTWEFVSFRQSMLHHRKILRERRNQVRETSEWWVLSKSVLLRFRENLFANVFFNSIKQCKCIFPSNKYFLSIRLSSNCLTRNLATKLCSAICHRHRQRPQRIQRWQRISLRVRIVFLSKKVVRLQQMSQHLLKKFSVTSL